MEARFYASAHAFVAEALQAGRDDPNIQHVLTGENVGRKFKTWEAVQEAATTLWKPGAEIIQRLVDSIDRDKLPTLQSVRRCQSWCEDGDDYSPERDERGLPCWRGSRRERRLGPAAIKILIDVATHWGREADAIFWRGAAAIAATKLLEEAGYRVELVICSGGRGSIEDKPGETDFVYLTLKEAGDPLDIATLAACCSGWFFRTVFFASKSLFGKTESGLGWPESVPEEPDAYIAERLWSQEDAMDWITGVLGKVNGE